MIKKLIKQIKSESQVIGALITLLLLVSAAFVSMIVFLPDVVKASPNVISSYEVDPTLWEYGDLKRINNTEYYLTGYRGSSGAVYPGQLTSVRIYNNNISILPSNISNYAFNNSAGYEVKLAKLPNTDIFVVFYQRGNGSGETITVHVNEDGTITNSKIDTQNATSTTNEIQIMYLYDDVFVTAFRQSTTQDGFIQTVLVSTDGQITGIGDTQIFDSGSGQYPYMTKIDDGTIAIVYSDVDSDGKLVTYNISDAGIITDTAADTWEFDTTQGMRPTIVHVSGDVYAIAYNGTDGDGFVGTVTIGTNGMITKSWLGTLEFDTVMCLSPYIFAQNTSGYYGVAYQSTAAAPTVKTFNISDDGLTVGPVIDTLAIDTVSTTGYGFESPPVSVNGINYACVYTGPGDDGWIKTFNVTVYEQASTASTYSLNFDLGTKIDWAGTAGTTVWSNETGNWHETMEINLSVNSTDNVTEIRVWVGDMNDSGLWLNASNISIQFSSDNITWGNATGNVTAFTDGGSNISVNTTQWTEANGAYGANPFTYGGIINTNRSIYCRFKISIPATLSTNYYYNYSSCRVYPGRYV